jgi:DNA-binding MarR family transcriptional regulator
MEYIICISQILEQPMNQSVKLDQELIERFHYEMVELVKKYQFRDRNKMTAGGISVSQCYLLEVLHRHGAQTMKAVAARLYLSVSTVTRVIEPLIQKGYIARSELPEDRRVRMVELTDDGREVFSRHWRAVFESERAILQNFPAAQRAMLVDFLRRLNRAVEEWRSECCGS